jgi:hypothetical protein
MLPSVKFCSEPSRACLKRLITEDAFVKAFMKTGIKVEKRTAQVAAQELGQAQKTR